MAVFVDIHDLPSRLTAVLALAQAGTEVVLTEGSVPRARIVPLHPSQDSAQRIPELHKGAIETSDDFDDPLPDEFWDEAPQT